MPPENVRVDLTKGTASMRLSRVSMLDQQDLANSLQGGPGVPVTVSFDIKWGGAGRRKEIRSAKERFRAQIVENTSTIEFQVEAGEFKFMSGPASTSKNVYSLIGRERNGVFF